MMTERVIYQCSVVKFGAKNYIWYYAPLFKVHVLNWKLEERLIVGEEFNTDIALAQTRFPDLVEESVLG